jgi:hypothetical protein
MMGEKNPNFGIKITKVRKEKNQRQQQQRDVPNWLILHTKKPGRFQSLAMLYDSKIWPWLAA